MWRFVYVGRHPNGSPFLIIPLYSRSSRIQKRFDLFRIFASFLTCFLCFSWSTWFLLFVALLLAPYCLLLPLFSVQTTNTFFFFRLHRHTNLCLMIFFCVSFLFLFCSSFHFFVNFMFNFWFILKS